MIPILEPQEALLNYLEQHPEVTVTFACVPEQGKLIGLIQYYILEWNIIDGVILNGVGPGANMSILMPNLGEYNYEENDSFSIAYWGAFGSQEPDGPLWFFLFQPGFTMDEE